MLNIESLIRFVNGQRDRINKIITDHPADDRSKHTLPIVARRYDEVIHVLQRSHQDQLELEDLRKQNADLQAELSKRKSALENLEVTPKDLDGLPPELIAQLSISESDREEFQILNILQEHGGAMSLDQLLIAIYRNSKEILDRTKLNQRLYRMASKDLLFPVPGRKGVYSIYESEQT